MMTSEEIRQHINNIFINIGHLLQDYLENKSNTEKCIKIEDIQGIVQDAISMAEFQASCNGTNTVDTTSLLEYQQFLERQNKTLKKLINTFYVLTKDIVKDKNIILDIPTTVEESLKCSAIKIKNKDRHELKKLVETSELFVDTDLLESEDLNNDI